MSLKITNTTISYSEKEKPILKIESLEFYENINFLIGKNGTGKSTLLKAISNYNDEVIVKGNLELDNHSLNQFNVGTVSQNPHKSINLELTFIENLILAKTNGIEHLSLLKQANKKNISYVIDFIEKFSNHKFLKRLLFKTASDLSSGQQQILAILMRVIRFQKILLLDECTANLDEENTKIILNILSELVKKGTIIIFATHQLELLKTYKTKIFKVENGTIKEQV